MAAGAKVFSPSFSSSESVNSITGPKDLKGCFPFPFLPFAFFPESDDLELRVFEAPSFRPTERARDCERVRTRIGEAGEEQRSIISFVRRGGIQFHGVERGYMVRKMVDCSGRTKVPETTKQKR